MAAPDRSIDRRVLACSCRARPRRPTPAPTDADLDAVPGEEEEDDDDEAAEAAPYCDGLSPAENRSAVVEAYVHPCMQASMRRVGTRNRGAILAGVEGGVWMERALPGRGFYDVGGVGTDEETF